MKKIINIPNILSVIRILMVPFIVWTMLNGRHVAAAWLFAVSSLTDVLDGIIARKFNMITDVGKILDPIADKLTQFSIAICISINHPMMWWIVAIIFSKEFLTLIGAIIFVNKVKSTPQAKWWGKLATVIIFFTMMIFILADAGAFSFILTDNAISEIETVALSLSIASLAFSFLNYILVYIEGRKKSKEITTESENNPQ